ncbi:hypothetical protein B9479_005790 [Cryptococcus floricola]|uniref:Uncharacterized protein n=1 Tax=Cryptococcus floricola TaxID=2591691 RepID=A0A5D3AQ40_9TREE|nr:hypothetical protein B9479_005790 [Cryptococcus floricola]
MSNQQNDTVSDVSITCIDEGGNCYRTVQSQSQISYLERIPLPKLQWRHSTGSRIKQSERSELDRARLKAINKAAKRKSRLKLSRESESNDTGQQPVTERDGGEGQGTVTAGEDAPSHGDLTAEQQESSTVMMAPHELEAYYQESSTAMMAPQELEHYYHDFIAGQYYPQYDGVIVSYQPSSSTGYNDDGGQSGTQTATDEYNQLWDYRSFD